MPACVIVSSSRQNGELDAVICAPGTNGPDRTSAVPVKVKLVSEQVLSVDGQPHEIIPTTGRTTATSFI
jgi:mRNA-degrading endonuclease toxin of MazEF toxin-antitoxin module